jgi:general L-amino acid transport system permease protein
MSGADLDLPRLPPAPLPPPDATVGRVTWLRRNLFNSLVSTVTTIFLGAVLLLVAIAAAQWLLNARWGVVTDNLRLLLVGQYEPSELWRVWLDLAILSVLTGVTAARGSSPLRTLTNWLAAGQMLLGLLILTSDMGPLAAGSMLVNAGLVWLGYFVGPRVALSKRVLSIAWLAFVVIAVVLLQGIAGSPLKVVPSLSWGGLLLTFLLAIAGIVLSFPFGVLLALGRRSDLPVIRALCTAFIEIVRGVPLVTILFMAAIMLPLFLPSTLRIDAVLRAIGGITIFSAAYVAENVRGGLQAIPSGQIEAANAIGLNAVQRNMYIVLPQALRSVIPANVGLFISLLKDTTLVFIAGLGLLELLGIGSSVLSRPEWFGARLEVYVFISAVFFVLCYTMSQASYRLEAAMGVGKR